MSLATLRPGSFSLSGPPAESRAPACGGVTWGPLKAPGQRGLPHLTARNHRGNGFSWSGPSPALHHGSHGRGAGRGSEPSSPLQPALIYTVGTRRHDGGPGAVEGRWLRMVPEAPGPRGVTPAALEPTAPTRPAARCSCPRPKRRAVPRASSSPSMHVRAARAGTSEGARSPPEPVPGQLSAASPQECALMPLLPPVCLESPHSLRTVYNLPVSLPSRSRAPHRPFLNPLENALPELVETRALHRTAWLWARLWTLGPAPVPCRARPPTRGRAHMPHTQPALSIILKGRLRTACQCRQHHTPRSTCKPGGAPHMHSSLTFRMNLGWKPRSGPSPPPRTGLEGRGARRPRSLRQRAGNQTLRERTRRSGI